jgi:glycosyltransferase involved in cell wall biosynthesis
MTGSGPTDNEVTASREDAELPDICVVTHPLAAAGENATRSLLDILGAITGVVLVTADLPVDSEIRGMWPVVELTDKGVGDSVPVAAARFLLNQLRMCLVLREREEPVALFYGATSYVLPIVFARLTGKTVLVEPRGDVPLTLRLTWEQRFSDPVAGFLAGIVRRLERLGFLIADGVVTYTSGMAEQLDLDPEADWVYPDGARYVRTDLFTVRIPYVERDRRVGFLGRLDEEKNVRELAAAARALPPDVTFVFIGDGDLHEWLETELSAEIEDGTVELRGWIDHDKVPRELNRLRLLVLPSEPTEGLPTTLLEALACGTPVCVSPVSGVPDVIDEGETGFFLDRTDPTHIRDEIRSILDREDLAEISRTGRRYVDRYYSFEAAADRYRNILARAVG